MDSGDLLRKITARIDKIPWILLIDNDLCRQQFLILAFDGS
jgi:hypothetical protein